MEYRLDELFDLQMGKTPARKNPEYWNSNDHKWISIADLSKCEKYITETKEHISSIAVQESGISEIPANTVIMSFKLSIGKTAITKEPIYSNEAIMSFRDKGVTPLLPDYIYYMFSGRDWSKGSNTAVMGTTLNKATLSQIRIYVHAYEDQKRIVELLDKVSSIISKRKQELVELDDLIKARFIELFGDPMTDVSKWSASTIGEQFNVSSGGTPATGEKAYWENGTIPWIGSNMCQDTMLSENDGKFITEEGYAHSSAKWFHKGTVLVALVGATIGKTALLRFDTTTNQNIAAIDVTQNAAFSSEFVFYHMQMLYSKFMEIGSGKFKMANQSFIRQLPLICPPIELQEQFAAFVEQTDKSKLLSGCRLFHSWAPENRDKPKHVGAPQRKTKDFRGCRCQQ